MPCNICQQEKPLQPTYARCVDCHNAVRREKHPRIKETFNAARRNAYRTNPEVREKAIKYAQEYVEKNYEKAKEGWRRLAAKKAKEKAEVTAKWRRENPEKYRMTRVEYRRKNLPKILAKNKQRQLTTIRRMPSWASKKEIEKFYYLAREITKRTGVKHHVDHIVPLRSQLVSGLHVTANLQVIPATENLRKRNHSWPDMPV